MDIQQGMSNWGGHCWNEKEVGFWLLGPVNVWAYPYQLTTTGSLFTQNNRE